MFSYRHAYHAGNHADVLKHCLLLATLDHLGSKDGALMLVDTHAGAGLYRLDSAQADASGEASDGILRLQQNLAATQTPAPSAALARYLQAIAAFNTGSRAKVYPGSPLLMQQQLRSQDRLKLFELHPSDSKLLVGHIEQLQAGRQIQVLRTDGFEGLKALLPPPSRRGLVLIDPSYEIKSDYTKVANCLQDALRRFSTGTYLVWYPVIPRPEAHSLPRRLKTMAQQAGKHWLHVTLSIGRAADASPQHPGLNASGMFVINPPHTLRAQMQPCLAELQQLLQRGTGASHSLDAG